ncbi:MAG: Gfo/Idh/MocA family protein [Christensenellales bacterium]|jgi:UDP-N-acetyl-2-amino-2-deoxyglucuronate dehydrogenase
MAGNIGAGIIGCGGVHVMHANALMELQGVTLRGLCDNKPDRADASARRYGGVAYTDYRKLLEDPSVDVIHITLPHYLHAQVTIDALKAGKWVLCEKPMAISTANARAMIAASDAVGGKLGIIFQNRYNAASIRLKKIVECGELGAIKGLRGMVNWYRNDAYYSDDWHGRKALEGGGVMMNQAIHTLDLMQWIGGEALNVYGMIGTASHAVDVEDMASLRIVFTGGAVGIFHATVSYVADTDVELEVFCENGTLLLRGNSLYQVNKKGLLEPLVGKTAGTKEGKTYWGTGHQLQIADFYHSIQAGLPVCIDGRQGFSALAIVQALYESAKTRKTVSVEKP